MLRLELGCAGDGAAASPTSPCGMHRDRGTALWSQPAGWDWERWEQWRGHSRENTLLEDLALLFVLTSPQAKAVTALTLLASVEVLKPMSACGFKTPVISHRNPLE